MFHAFIWLSEKNKTQISGIKKKKKIVGLYCSKCWNWEFWTYFFTEINVYVITQRVKYWKKVPLGTGTEFQVPIPVPVLVQMWAVPNPNHDTDMWIVNFLIFDLMC